VTYFSSLDACYISLDYGEMQNVNMQHNYLDIHLYKENAMKWGFGKLFIRYPILPACDFQHVRCNLFMLTYNLIILTQKAAFCMKA
jgi:hypothetical protein